MEREIQAAGDGQRDQRSDGGAQAETQLRPRDAAPADQVRPRAAEARTSAEGHLVDRPVEAPLQQPLVPESSIYTPACDNSQRSVRLKRPR